MAIGTLDRIGLVRGLATTIRFDDATFDVGHFESGIKVARGQDDYALVSQKSQQVTAEAGISGGMVLSVEKTGEIDYSTHFVIDWTDEDESPQLILEKPPVEIVRRYERGQSMELGLEDVNAYRVVYRDGVEARFEREGRGFKFSFSTGFYGSAWQDPDGSFTLKFKGDKLEPAEEAYRSQSKFIISRSKYSGNLLLVLQDSATVYLE